MELKKINYEITINAGNYQSIRYGMEYSVSKSDKIEDDTLIMLDALMRQQIQAVLEARKSQVEKTTTATPKCEEKASKEANGEDNNNESTPNETPKECAKESPKAPKKERLTKDANKLQAILNRMQQGVSIDKVLEFYDPDETAMQVLEMQEMLNNKEYEPKYLKKNEDK